MERRYCCFVLSFKQFQQKPKLTSFYRIEVFIYAKNAVRKYATFYFKFELVGIYICLNQFVLSFNV